MTGLVGAGSGGSGFRGIELRCAAAARATVGGANRAKAVAEYDEATMIARYQALYEQALDRPGALG